MPRIVRLISDDRGEKYPNSYWHYITNRGGGSMSFCTGEFFREGESGCKYLTKEGKITCPSCIEEIKKIKNIKL